MERNAQTGSSRLYGMMQHLLMAYAHGRLPQAAGPRGVVQHQDVLDAVINVAAYLDGNAQAGNLDRNEAEHMAALLMVIRDYIQPLPFGPTAAPDGSTVDGVTPDLQEMVDGIRIGRAQSGRQG